MFDVPPAIYDHEPKQPYHVLVLPELEVMDRCYGIVNACAIPKRRLIVISDHLEGAERDEILRHEKAHLNGWIHEGRMCVATENTRCVSPLTRPTVMVKSMLRRLQKVLTSP